MQPHQLLHLPILRRTRVALRSPDKQLMTTDLTCFRRDATRLRCFLPATHIINIAQRCLQDQIKGNDIRELTVDDEVWFWPNRVATVGSKAAMADRLSPDEESAFLSCNAFSRAQLLPDSSSVHLSGG
jgi:hypothetical protein